MFLNWFLFDSGQETKLLLLRISCYAANIRELKYSTQFYKFIQKILQ